MKTVITCALMGVCWMGWTANVRAQQAVPPEIERPGPVRMPPDFKASPRKPEPRRPPFDASKAQERAQELATLAGKVPDEINQVSHNVLPKDLIHNLKRIEKLAKQLRGQVSR